MIRNYLKIAWRSLLKHRSFSVINILGLAVSMSVCLLIIMLVAEQKSYDQFHSHKDHVYRVHTLRRDGQMNEMASSALPLADKLKQDYPDVAQTASLVRNIGGDILYHDKVVSGGGYFADGRLFDVLDFELSQGNATTALQRPFSLVIDERFAQQLFGTQSPLGKVVRFNDKGINPGGPEKGNQETAYGDFTITGVLKPNPGKTHLPFRLLASLSTLGSLTKDSVLYYPPNDWSNVWSNYTYVRLKPQKSKADLQQMLDQLSAKVYSSRTQDQYVYKAVSLNDILLSEAIGNPTSVYIPRMVLMILGILCLIVMASACLNYTNLSIARALARLKEVGVRKVVGATKKQIFAQFIAEAILVSLFALVVAVGLLELLKFGLMRLWLNQYLNVSFEHYYQAYLGFVVFSVLVGLLAGFLPSYYIAKFNPIHVFKGLNNLKLFSKLTLRRVLLVLQFSISLIFIISTALIVAQTNHLLDFNYGFDQSNVLNVRTYKPEYYQRFVQAVATQPEVSAVGACAFLPATGTQNGTRVYRNNRKDSLQASYIDIDAKCLEVWKIQLLAGQNFPEIPSSTGEQYLIINQKMVQDFKLGNPQQAIGQRIEVGDKSLIVRGVVKDFQFLDVSRKLEPLMLRNRPNQFGFATLRIAGHRPAQTLATIEKIWKKVNPNTKFEYDFWDQQLLFMHSVLSDLATVLGVLAFLAVFISCLGLLGMATYTAETRQKEIGIRKVLGSSVLQIILLLSKNFVVLLGVALLIGTPLAYFINNLWLEFFASRVAISPSILLMSAGILLVISLLTVFSQSWRVARMSPVKSLKAE